MVEHFLVGLLAVAGGVDSDEFYFGEFVETVEAAYVFAVGAGFATEALGVGAVLDGHVALVEDYVAVDVGDGDFGCGDEVEVVFCAVVHLSFFVGKLACAVAGGGVDYCGGDDFCVAALLGFVEEEVDEGALESGALAFVDGEAGACDFYAEVEVDEVVFFGEFPVGTGVFGEGFDVAAFFDYEVVVGCAAFGYFVVGDVGDVVEHFGHLFFSCLHLCFKLLVGLLHSGYAFAYGCGFFFFAFAHELAYLF